MADKKEYELDPRVVEAWVEGLVSISQKIKGNTNPAEIKILSKAWVELYHAGPSGGPPPFP